MAAEKFAKINLMQRKIFLKREREKKKRISLESAKV